MKGQASEPQTPDAVSDCFIPQYCPPTSYIKGKCLPSIPHTRLLLTLCKHFPLAEEMKHN